MRPDLSEFSFGYALTESLIASSPWPLKAAPVFPSLYEEGKTGGYDVKLPFDGFPLFLQFKLSDPMKRASCIEAKKGLLYPPFFRMHLRPTKRSKQHPLLLQLEASGAAVYYVAPKFSDTSDLNRFYVAKSVAQKSLFIKPSEIGPLPDDKEHHISFKKGKPVYLFSNDPRLVKENEADHEPMNLDLSDGFWKYERLGRNQESVRSWANRLTNIVRENRIGNPWYSAESIDAIEDMPALRALTYTALVHFGCNILLVAPSTDSQAEG